MGITNGYCSLAELKIRLNVDDVDDDNLLENIVEGASRAIDDYCGRRFYGVAETRYLTAEYGDVLFLPWDLTSVTTLKTDDDGDRAYETTWATTDYDLAPFNAALDGKPYTRIELTPNGNYSFPTTRKGVEINGGWGYVAAGAATPSVAVEACLLWASRLFKRKDAVFGVTGSPETGLLRLPAMDPDIKLLLQPFRRLDVLAV